MATLKIGIGHELVIVARKPGSAPLYVTDRRTWSTDPRAAKMFTRAADAHKKSPSCAAGADYRVSVEGICCPEFGHA